MRIAVGANRRGLQVREQVLGLLGALGHEVLPVDLSPGPSAEYPEIAAGVAQQVQHGEADYGILIGRTGTGMCIVANKFPGVRAAVCYDELMVETSRRYLDVNVLCLPADLLSEGSVDRMVKSWLSTAFEGGRHARRRDRVSLLEKRCILLTES